MMVNTKSTGQELMKTFDVEYKIVNGAHFFISTKDERLRGFCVAHKDYSKALNGAFMAIRTLYKENHGVDLSAEGIAMNIHEWTEKDEKEFQKRLDELKNRKATRQATQEIIARR